MWECAGVGFKAVRLCGLGIYLGAQLCVLWNLRLVCFVGIMMDKHFAVAKPKDMEWPDYQAVIKINCIEIVLGYIYCKKFFKGYKDG